MLTNADLVELTEFRRKLHRFPEISGEEHDTARAIAAALEELPGAHVMRGIGGHGVAAVFEGKEAGPTVLFRAELDALPIAEISDVPWRSAIPGKGHLCGHDGHMTMLLALGRLIAREPIAKGRAVLMFQPAEEDGSGARAVVRDPAFAKIAPDWAFAIHNLPGRVLGEVGLRPGLINCASQGLEIRLTGKTAHAATPEDGISPVQAVGQLMAALADLGRGGATLDDDFRLLTITHVRIGEPTFGISPGDAVLHATLRTGSDAAMDDLAREARDLVAKLAERQRLAVSIEPRDDFAASINDPEATEVARSALDAVGVCHGETDLPMRASEDFGVFGQTAKAAMLLLGSGERHAALHNPDYDFPDDLLPIGARIFERIARDLLGRA